MVGKTAPTAKSSRRSTRVSRSVTSGTGIIPSPKPNFSSHRKNYRHSVGGTFRRRSRNKNNGNGSIQKWAKAMRHPAYGVGFLVPKWIPIEQLTREERLKYDDDQSKKEKGKVKSNVDKIQNESKDNYTEKDLSLLPTITSKNGAVTEEKIQMAAIKN